MVSSSGGDTPAATPTTTEAGLEDCFRYPPGCPVWCHYSTTAGCRLDALSGHVKRPHNHNNRIVYYVQSTDSQDEKACAPLWDEDQLSFAINTPVKVRGMIEGDPTKELDGKIACPELRNGKVESYTVRFSPGGKRIWLETGVEADRIAYRKPEKTAGANTGKVSECDEKEVNGFVDTGVEAKKTHEEQNESQEAEDPTKEDHTNDKATNSDKKDTPNGDAAQNISSNISLENAHADSARLPDTSSEQPVQQNMTTIETNDHQPPSPNQNENQTSAETEPSAPLKTKEPMENRRSSTSTSEPKSTTPASTPTEGSESSSAPKSSPTSKSQAPESNHKDLCQRWKSPPSPHPQPQGNRCMLAIPVRVMKSSKKSLFTHIVGTEDDGKLGHKTQAIENTTGYSVSIPLVPQASLFYIIMRPKASFVGDRDFKQARKMVNDSLVEFLGNRDMQSVQVTFDRDIIAAVESSARKRKAPVPCHPVRTPKYPRTNRNMSPRGQQSC